MANKKPDPTWMNLAADRVTVTLSKPTEFNGVQTDKISLRSPTVRDMRAAQNTGDGDDEQREMNLFASLAEVGVKDVEGLTLKDYTRLQTGYFRLVHEDDV